MKLYTKGGDKGRTSLIGGERVAKTDERVEAYGSVDELTAFVALLGDCIADTVAADKCSSDLRRINSLLMNVESIFATGDACRDKVRPLVADRSAWCW